MRLNTQEKFVRVSTASGALPYVVDWPVAASQTIKKGDFLIISSGASTCEQAIALPGSNSTETSSGSVSILGVAMADITTTASVSEATDRIPVALANDDLRILLPIYNSSASAAEPQDLTRGTAYQLSRWRGTASTIWWYAVDTGTSNGELIYVNRSSANDEDYGKVWVTVASASQALIA